MSPRDSSPPPSVSVPLTGVLELRLQTVLDTASGDFEAIDVRLHRRAPHAHSEGAFLPTLAGFRIRPQQIPELVAALERFVGA